MPFWILNHFGWFGITTGLAHGKTFFLYTSYSTEIYDTGILNAGMFWEPGAFSGYLILSLVFVALKNGKFQFGKYQKEVFWIIIGIISTQFTTGFIAFGLILNVYVFQNYGWARIVVLPLTIFIIYWGYFEIDFIQKKIETQFEGSTQIAKDDISNSRFGALAMDLQYINAKPLIGNGLDAKTRYRFYPWVKEDIGHGNGMSNFLVYGGHFSCFVYTVFIILYKRFRNLR